MKSKTKRTYKVGKIQSLDDLKLEKAKLELEIVRKEDEIKINYRHIVDAFTLRNLFQTVSQDIAASSTIITKVVEAGRNIFKRKKKKKKERQDAMTQATVQPIEKPAGTDEIAGE